MSIAFIVGVVAGVGRAGPKHEACCVRDSTSGGAGLVDHGELGGDVVRI